VPARGVQGFKGGHAAAAWYLGSSMRGQGQSREVQFGGLLFQWLCFSGMMLPSGAGGASGWSLHQGFQWPVGDGPWRGPVLEMLA
jgi:hypothetical protein